MENNMVISVYYYCSVQSCAQVHLITLMNYTKRRVLISMVSYDDRLNSAHIQWNVPLTSIIINKVLWVSQYWRIATTQKSICFPERSISLHCWLKLITAWNSYQSEGTFKGRHAANVRNKNHNLNLQATATSRQRDKGVFDVIQGKYLGFLSAKWVQVQTVWEVWSFVLERVIKGSKHSINVNVV